jgi:hypothetical protein
VTQNATTGSSVSELNYALALLDHAIATSGGGDIQVRRTDAERIRACLLKVGAVDDSADEEELPDTNW